MLLLLSAILGVTAALVFENTLLVPDLDGRPAKSFEAVVEGGSDGLVLDRGARHVSRAGIDVAVDQRLGRDP